MEAALSSCAVLLKPKGLAGGGGHETQLPHVLMCAVLLKPKELAGGGGPHRPSPSSAPALPVSRQRLEVRGQWGSMAHPGLQI